MSLDLEEKQSLVLGLVIQCPFKMALPTCPAVELRKLSSEGKVEAVKNMTENSLNEIIEYHKQCGRER